MKYLFHTLDLGPTGGSRVILDLSELLLKNGHEVLLIVEKNKIAFAPPPGLKIYLLNALRLTEINTATLSGITQKSPSHSSGAKPKRKKRKLRDKYPAVRSLYKWTKYIFKMFENIPRYLHVQSLLRSYRPDLIVTHNMYSNLEHFFFYKRYGLSIIIHNSPRDVYIERDGKHLLPLSAYYRGLHCINITEAGQKELQSLIPPELFTTQIIYNPLNVEMIQRKAAETPEIPLPAKSYIINVNSLSKRKRVDRVLNAFAKIERPDLELLILGEGPERPYLEEEIRRLKIGDRVHMPGFVENPYPYIKNAECLILSSDSEGFGLVLVEALFLQTAVVSTDCPHGPSELLVDKLAPYLVSLQQPEEKITTEMAEKIVLAMENPPADFSPYYTQFLPETILHQWEALARQRSRA